MVLRKDPNLQSRNLEIKAFSIINEQSINGYLLIGREFKTRTSSQRLETIVFIGVKNGKEFYTGCDFEYNKQSEELQLKNFQQVIYAGNIPTEIPYNHQSELEHKLFSYIISIIQSKKHNIFLLPRYYSVDRANNNDTYRGVPYKQRLRFRESYLQNSKNLARYIFSTPIHARDWDENYRPLECLIYETASPPEKE